MSSDHCRIISIGIENVSSSRLNLGCKKSIFGKKKKKKKKKKSPRRETSNFLCLKARKIIEF